MRKLQPPTEHLVEDQADPHSRMPSSDDDASSHSRARKVDPQVLQWRKRRAVRSPSANASHEDVYALLPLLPRTAKRSSLSTHPPQPERPTPIPGTPRPCRIQRTLHRLIQHLCRRHYIGATRTGDAPVRQSCRRKTRARVQEVSLRCAYACCKVH